MADEPQFKRPDDSFRFAFGGLNTRDSPDAMPPGKYAIAQNVRSTGSNSIRTRPGYVSLFTTGSNAITDIAGYAALQTDSLPRFLAHDTAGTIWLDNNNSVGNLNGSQGYGASMIPFRPSESPVPWMYIGVGIGNQTLGPLGDYQKFSAPDSSNNVTQYKVGIAEPQNQVEAAPQFLQFRDFQNASGNWVAAGTAGNVSAGNRVADTLGTCVVDPALSTRYYCQVGNNANAQYGIGQEIALSSGASVIVQDIFPAVGSNLTAQAVYSNNGITTVSISTTAFQQRELGGIAGLRRGSLLNIANSVALVLGVIDGPNGQQAFQTSSNVSNGATISGVPSLALDAFGSVISAGLTVTCPVYTSAIGAGNNNANAGTLTLAFTTSPFASSFPLAANTFIQQEDYLHMSVAFSDPSQLIQMLIMFNLDGGNNNNNFNGNVLYYAVRPGDLTGLVNGNQTVLPAMLQSAEDLIIGQLPNASNISAPSQSAAGNNQYAEILFPVSALTRLGGDQTRTLVNASAIQLQVSVANNTSVSWGGLYVSGGFPPDVGNNGASYRYQCVPLSTPTGIRGNPTPVMRYGVNPRRQSVTVKTSNLNSNYDVQIDTWEIYRYGGSITSYRFIGTTPTGSDFIDNVFDDAAAAGTPLVTDNTEPWPSIDAPWRVTSGNANIAASGPFLTVTGNGFILPLTGNRWLPGTLLQVGGSEAYTLRSRPIKAVGSITFECQECIGSGNQTSAFVLEPNVANQPLPYLWGPNEQGYIFGCGDPLRPSTVSWCKAFAPDNVPTAYNLELCPPSEPLLGGEVISGVSLVASSLRWWALYFQSGGVPLFSKVEIPVGKRLASPYGKCTDGRHLYFWATDCIAMTSGQGGAIALTDADLYNLFPHGGLSGKNVTRGSVTYYAPDYSRAATFRMAIREGVLYALYQDSTGTPRMLIGQMHGETAAWSQDSYAASMTAVYAIEQPKGTLQKVTPALYPAVVMGSNNGSVWKLQDLTNDGGNANGANISGLIGTHEWDGGDVRADFLWGDQYVDIRAPFGMTVTPVSQSNSVAANTTISANANRQFVPVSMNGGQLLGFVGLQFAWTDNFNSSNNATILHSWQPSFVPKPETIQDRYGDWTDFGQASYVRGLIIHADTNGNNKNISIRNADTNNLVTFSGGPANNQINHNGEQEKAYYFNPPFVAHMARDEAQDSVSWRKFQFEWIKDPWPELTRLPSPWMNLGQDGAKYLRGAVIPMDTNGANVSLSFVSSDGGNNVTVGPFNTTAAQKTAVPFAFTTPLIGHDFQFLPSNNIRVWYEEIRWDAEIWPELITESTPWMDLGTPGDKYIRGVVLPLDTGNNNTTLTFKSPSGANQTVIVNSTASIKTPYPIAFSTPFVCESLQITVNNAVRIWWNEARWDADPWPERIPEASAWFNMGTPGAKYLRGAVIPLDTGGNNVNINFISSDGGNVAMAANTAANVKTPTAFAFTVPLIGHEFQLVPSANNSVRIWWEEVKWIYDAWPELTREASPWMNLGSRGAKYLRGAVIPVDSNGANASLTMVSSDGGNATIGPFSTTAGQKTDVPWPFTTPLVGHEFQLVPANNVRVWYDDIRWDADPWPERIAEASAWFNMGTPGAKYLRGAVIPLESNNANVSINFISSDGGNVALSATTAVNVKTPVAFAFTVPLIGHEFQLVPTANNSVRIWWEEVQWIFDKWPEFTREASPWMDLGTPGAKYLRGCVIPMDTGGNNASLTFVSSDGGNNNTVGPFDTTTSEKTAVAFAFTTPLIGHEFQFIPGNNMRVWYDEIKWMYDPWPEFTTEASSWMDLGAQGAKYLRGAVIPIDTGGNAVSLTLISSDGGNNNTVGPFTTTTSEKTAVPWAFDIPLIGHDFQLIPGNNARVWYPEIRWDFDPWPELINEATGWMPVLPGGGAAFLQGLVLPIETNASTPALSLLTDTGLTIALAATVTPPANVKTGVAYSLATPVVCHQVQIVPTSPCRIWLNEIQWFAEATSELASTWTTQWTALGGKGYKTVPRIEPSYSSTQAVSLIVSSYDGQSPRTLTLPATGGATQKILLTLSFNKGTLYRFSATSSATFQIFMEDSAVYVFDWGRGGEARMHNLLGAPFGDRARI